MLNEATSHGLLDCVVAGFDAEPGQDCRDVVVDRAVGVLTERQSEVLRLVAAGLTNQEIADELFVARRTVDNHVSAILTRLGVESRHDAVEEAVARGLVAPS